MKYNSRSPEKQFCFNSVDSPTIIHKTNTFLKSNQYTETEEQKEEFSGDSEAKKYEIEKTKLLRPKMERKDSVFDLEFPSKCKVVQSARFGMN